VGEELDDGAPAVVRGDEGEVLIASATVVEGACGVVSGVPGPGLEDVPPCQAQVCGVGVEGLIELPQAWATAVEDAVGVRPRFPRILAVVGALVAGERGLGLSASPWPR
jgi:hypothetical protein